MALFSAEQSLLTRHNAARSHDFRPCPILYVTIPDRSPKYAFHFSCENIITEKRKTNEYSFYNLLTRSALFSGGELDYGFANLAFTIGVMDGCWWRSRQL
jgi:hypothetical protein